MCTNKNKIIKFHRKARLSVTLWEIKIIHKETQGIGSLSYSNIFPILSILLHSHYGFRNNEYKLVR